MKHLQFLGIYKDLLIDGKKDITIRLTKPKLKPGEIFIIDCGGKSIGKFRVKNIYTKKIKEITDEEAIRDGYKNKEDLIIDLKRIYKGIDDNKEVVIIEFEPVEIFKDQISSEEFAWGGKKYNIPELAKIILENFKDIPKKDVEILKLIIEKGSMRKAALHLGGLEKRYVIRKVLKKYFYRLKKQNLI